jgi:hypothetical protein
MRVRRTATSFGVILVLVILGLLFLAWRTRTVDCVRSLVKFEVRIAGLKQARGGELVITTAPADGYGADPALIPVGNGVSTHQVVFNPFSREKLNCSRRLETVEITLKENGEALANRTLTYPQDFVVDAQGEYIAREAVVFEP